MAQRAATTGTGDPAIAQRRNRDTRAIVRFALVVGWMILGAQRLPGQVDPMFERMVDSISVSNLGERIHTLERAGGHFSRVNFTPGNDSAAVYLKQAFDAIPGLTSVVYDTFYIASAGGGFSTKPMVNIVATLQGTTAPSKVFVAGAHFDCSGSRMGSSWSSQWQTMVVPGADDNASGLAVLLEMARIISDPSFGYLPQASIQFVAFGAEESGPAYSGSHLGSRHFADSIKALGVDVIGMVSIDMIGYNPLHLYQSIITNASSTFLAAGFAGIASVYAPQLLINTTNDATATYSDHDSFWKNGYPAICLMENAPPWNSNAYYNANPFYHKSSDTSGTVNLELVRQVARMALAAVATRAWELTDMREVNTASVPAAYRLEQNYPNPFNPSTTVEFRLPAGQAGIGDLGLRNEDLTSAPKSTIRDPKSTTGSVASSHVTLKVYDLLGREVAVLVNGRKPAGSYTVEFNGSGLSSGVYFLRLEAGSFRAVRKMMLVK